jgi:hypothetical protein
MRSLKTCRWGVKQKIKDQEGREGENQVGMGAAAPVRSSKVSAGAQVQKRFMSPYAGSR